MADLSTQIEEQVQKSAASVNDGVSITRRSISELIEADKYLAGKTAAAATPATMFRSMTAKIVAPGGH